MASDNDVGPLDSYHRTGILLKLKKGKPLMFSLFSITQREFYDDDLGSHFTVTTYWFLFIPVFKTKIIQ